MKTSRIPFCLIKILIVFVLLGGTEILKAQEALTIEKAMEIAESSSPSLQLSLLNLEDELLELAGAVKRSKLL